MRLLRTNGFSCSITSNSFLRADYGGPLRSVIAKNCAVHSLISIDKSQVFQNAIVNVAILLFSKDREQADAYAVAGRLGRPAISMSMFGLIHLNVPALRCAEGYGLFPRTQNLKFSARSKQAKDHLQTATQRFAWF